MAAHPTTLRETLSSVRQALSATIGDLHAAADATGVDLTIDPETAAEEPIHRHLTPAEARALAACLMHFAQETTR